LTSNDVVRPKRSECPEQPDLCGKAIYKLGTTGVKISLPQLNLSALESLYSRAYNGQHSLPGGPAHERPTQQAHMILNQELLHNKTGLTIVETGCAAGYTLYNVRELASNGGKIICFEPDADFTEELTATFQSASKATIGLSTEHRQQFFNSDQLAPASVDLFMSSHAVEHLVEPCPWLAALMKVLKPGGLVFTEVPLEYDDPDQNITRGLFHMMYFNVQSWRSMMLQAGFEEIELNKGRSIFRLPLPKTVAKRRKALPKKHKEECTDTPSPWMVYHGMVCADNAYMFINRCNADLATNPLREEWIANKYCQLSCWVNGNGYPGDDCSSTQALAR